MRLPCSRATANWSSYTASKGEDFISQTLVGDLLILLGLIEAGGIYVYKVLIYGAGSIGNHLAHACRNKGWGVVMCDSDPEALKRTKEDIYPSRYGRWDSGIHLAELNAIPPEKYEVVIIGTPPDTHVGLAIPHPRWGTVMRHASQSPRRRQVEDRPLGPYLYYVSRHPSGPEMRTAIGIHLSQPLDGPAR